MCNYTGLYPRGMILDGWFCLIRDTTWKIRITAPKHISMIVKVEIIPEKILDSRKSNKFLSGYVEKCNRKRTSLRYGQKTPIVTYFGKTYT